MAADEQGAEGGQAVGAAPVEGQVLDPVELEDNNEFLRIIEELIPPPGGELEDVFGHTHVLPKKIGARQQVELGRRISALVQKAMATYQAVSEGSVTRADVVVALSGILSGDDVTEELLNALDESFELALPRTLRSAREKAKAEGEEKAESMKATDLFDLQGVAKALVPFCARAVLEALGIAKRFQPGA